MQSIMQTQRAMQTQGKESLNLHQNVEKSGEFFETEDSWDCPKAS